jgi:putative methyltransferase (TIGR04325 family)
MTDERRYGLLERLDSLIFRRLLPPRTYATWQAAEKQAARNSYARPLVNEFRVARRRSVDQTIPWTTAYRTSVNPTLASVTENGFRITDFGGATGDMGDLTIEANPTIRYTVVENPILVSLMQQQETKVQFTTEIPHECDVFYTSGTLQYISEPYEALRRGLLSAKRFTVLVRNNFSQVERFMIHRSRLFDNGSGPLPLGFKNRVIKYPLRTIQEDRVREIALQSGFVLARERDDPEFNYKGGYSKDLIFKRIRPSS